MGANDYKFEGGLKKSYRAKREFFFELSPPILGFSTPNLVTNGGAIVKFGGANRRSFFFSVIYLTSQ
jgi:hypothetical protein